MKRLLIIGFTLALGVSISHAAGSYEAVTVSSWTVPPTTVLANDGGRRSATIYNAGGQTIYCGFDVNVSTSNGMPITAGAAYETGGDDRAWRGPIYCKAAAASSGVDVRVWRWTR